MKHWAEYLVEYVAIVVANKNYLVRHDSSMHTMVGGVDGFPPLLASLTVFGEGIVVHLNTREVLLVAERNKIEPRGMPVDG